LRIRHPDTPPGELHHCNSIPCGYGGPGISLHRRTMRVSGPVVPKMSVPARDTASGSHTMTATATSRGTGAQWGSCSMTARLSTCRCQRRSGQSARNSRVQRSGGGCLDLGVIPRAKGRPPQSDLEPAGGTATVLTFALTEIEDSLAQRLLEKKWTWNWAGCTGDPRTQRLMG